ncbi:hypothetical protein [Rhodococcus sp. NBC_00294]|uniref:hypothetical protein n=1 Tax=Rhodococcus sp. NBC_00294 TaxID=2976004 RepID=UPI002E291BF7|nr:hypothetical protein [Rhodococcus sp. NBC_00294]
MSSTDTYWTTYDNALDDAAGATTTGELIAALNRHFAPSAGVAFFPNGADRDLLGTLTDAGHFTLVWMRADYYFAMRDSAGDGFTFIEGDLVHGVERPL